MTSALVAAVSALALVMAAWTGLAAARARRVGTASLVGLAVVEVTLLVLVVVLAVDALDGTRPVETATAVAYLVLAPFLLPAAALWSLADRSRYSPLVLTVACLGLAVVAYRMLLLWQVQQ
ncbi:hypothetical protein CLV92_11324 [Kineococcus xinjiangensis]|uniref:Integral membrane protein n=1 Tax=Kineococcus xinjiangensis TaxID=512762 RepID=A0A2S6IEE5_9ACTN|nr:hypothetical protein [Kineococcus xinjiangensis]PPK92595.1 hypothetical protein CLV92_11324 [Kineococcus xinjiangensis]